MCEMVPFDANNITLDNWEGIKRVRKKPIEVHAAQINLIEGFSVETKEGTMTGKCGDYLMFGIDGEKYPCDKSIFERSYDVVDVSFERALAEGNRILRPALARPEMDDSYKQRRENMEPKASIGRIVHFYKPKSNQTDFEGPFAAIVTNVHDEAGQFANLYVFPHYGDAYYQGSVWHKGHEHQSGMYWEFPPRV